MSIESKERKSNFSDFGKSFQDTLVKSIALDKDFCSRMQEVMEIGFFELKHHQIIVKKIFDHRDKYNKHPSVETIKTIIKSDLGDIPKVLKDKTQEFINKIFSGESGKVDDASFVKDKSLDFCKKQRLYVAMEKSIELLDKASFDEISTVINDAIKLGEENKKGYDYIKDFELRFKSAHRNPVSTGWDSIDQISGGGLGRGELGVLIGPTSAGKSFVLVHLGAQAIKKGKNVVHYTLELSDTYVANRYDSCITETRLDDRHIYKDMIYETVSKLSGSLLIKEYPTKTVSTRTIRSHLDRLKQDGKETDMIIVDYGDLLRSTTNYKEKRDNLESIYQELRAIAQDYECPVWTVSQCNRSGLNAEVITMESISEAFSKCFIADFIFSLSRTIDDKNSNTGRIFIAKNRSGPDGIIFPIFMDTSRAKIDVLKTGAAKVTDEDPFTSSEDKLKERYKKHLKDRKNGG